ncbi:MAG: acyl-CoA thioesterase [Actinobacteria bacterium]|nr:acyl-CoA thioesterase [Actinomycetota bacterium]
MHEKNIEIRWRDVDAYGHVNNAVYLTYLEEARDEWLQTMLGSDDQTWEFVLGRVAIDYRSELTLKDDAIKVCCRLASMGTSSFRTREEIFAGDRLAAEAEAVVVASDRKKGCSRPLTDSERAALERDRPRRTGA